VSSERQLLPTASTTATRRAAARLLRPRRGLASAAVSLLVAAAAAGLVAPPLLGRIVDAVVDQRSSATIAWLALGLVIVAVVAALLSALGQIVVARLGEATVADLREDVMGRAVSLDIGTIERAGRGDLVSRLADDVRLVAEAVTTVVPSLANAGFTIALTIAGLGVLDWRFAVAALCAVPIQAHTTRWYLRRSGPVYAATRIAEGAQAQQLLESLDGSETVRTLALTEQHVGLVAERSIGAVDADIASLRMSTRFYGRLNVAEVVGLSSLLIVGFVIVRDGQVSVGTATAAALYFMRLFDPINLLLGRLDTAQSAAAGLARLVGVLDIRPASAPSQAAVPHDASIEIVGVGFAYHAGHQVLHDVSIRVAPGERVALVGASGAGKTTLAKLVAGVLEATSGTIHIGGASHAELGPDGVRRAVALVTQEVHVFAGPLAADLRLARPDATDAELEDALLRVGALPWVRRLPDGLATIVGDGGHRLSTSQAQQLALARVLLVNPPIALLDEATAEAGSTGARELEAAAAEVLRGRTALVVAHRLTQAAAADRIVVFDHGRVVEQGSHDELAARDGGTYARLWQAWSTARDTPAPVAGG
jgi:ATP-binding cassette subfamily C protein